MLRSLVRSNRRSILAIWSALVLLAPAQAQGPPEVKPRAEGYFGLHFDLHASLGIQNAGESLTEAMVEDLIDRVRPDWIQVDCKGHPGISSYPTQVPAATHVSGFKQDPLALYRQVTARRGVALYVHYSGVWDSQAVKQHPEWAALNEDDKPSDQHISFFGPYVDEVLIPQMKELRGEYKINGAWIDGECWAVRPDFRPDALAAFQQASGLATVPRKADDEGYGALLDFTRGRFRDYMRHYVDVLHREAPGLELCSNWAYSSRMPEPVDVPLDFLSGDFSPTNSVRVGAYEARCLEPQARSVGRPWDLMDWSFARDWDAKERPADPKSAVQLMQSAAQVLALGGAYQVYFKQNSDLSFRPSDIPVMADLARFVHERQAVCHRSAPVPQVALLYSRAGWALEERQVYQTSSRPARSMEGMLLALLDSQLSVEILMTHHLQGHVADYPLLVIPDWREIEPELASEIVAHVEQGGRLLLVGPGIAAFFADRLPVKTAARPGAGSTHLGFDGRWAAVTNPAAVLEPGAGVDVLAHFYGRPDATSRQAPAAMTLKLGKGEVGVVLPDLGQAYRDRSSPVVRDLITALAARLMPEPLAQVTGSRDVHLVTARRDERLLINLLNVAGPHADRQRPVFDQIPPVGPLSVQVRLPRAPGRVTLEPGGNQVEHRFADGVLTVTVPTVEIHRVVAIE